MSDSPEITDLASFAKKHQKLLIISAVIFIIIASLATVTFLIFDRQAKHQAELLYWENIKEQPTDDLYCKYLEKYPNGEFKDIAVLKLDGRFCETKLRRYKAKDGVVEDTETGLIWMRCAIGKRWGVEYHGEKETCFGSADKMNWEQASSIPANLKYASHDDWRIPTVDELATLVCSALTREEQRNDNGEEGSIVTCVGKHDIEDQVFPQVNHSDGYWTSSPGSALSSNVRNDERHQHERKIVHMANNYDIKEEDTRYKDAEFYVRLVR